MRERQCIGDSRVCKTRTETNFNAIFTLIRVKVTLVAVWFALVILFFFAHFLGNGLGYDHFVVYILVRSVFCLK